MLVHRICTVSCFPRFEAWSRKVLGLFQKYPLRVQNKFTTSDIADFIAKDTTNAILAALERKDKRLASIFRLRLQGIRAAEVGRMLEIKKSSLYDQLNIIKEIAVKYL